MGIEQYVEDHFEETMDLLRALGKIPAPSHMEEKRAEFVCGWLKEQGAEDVKIDEAKNVVCRIAGEKENDLVVIMAHTDVVFSDTEELPLKEENGKLFAPGIGDDTACLVNLLMSVKYLIEIGKKPACTLLFVANSCEEGLGNLKGSRKIYQDYGNQIREWISFDGYLGKCTDRAVGSYRYRVTVKTLGGHSYADFGRENAIAVLAELIHELYQIQVPDREKTTYNVGVIEGGSTVNSIAQKASMLYEFRSADQSCLEEMEEKFMAAVNQFREKGYDIQTEVIGIRPGSGPIDEERLKALTQANVAVIESCLNGERVTMEPSSTDANIPLSVGIPANTFGVVAGGLAHTREEWIDIASMKVGLKIALKVAARY